MNRSQFQAVLPVSISDPCPLSDAPLSLAERWCVQWLTDVRDLVFVRLAWRASLTLLSVAAMLFFSPAALVFWLALPYLWLLYAVYGGPVMLMVHAVEHRPAFKGRGRILQGWIRHVMPLFYGISPIAYRAHHLLMHHADENRQGDISSTLPYRRDSGWHFLHYCLRFLLVGNLQLARYLARRGRKRALRRFLAGETAHFFLMGLALWRFPAAAALVLLLPYVLTRFFLMAGNWAQHAFVNLERLDDGAANATILLNASHNHRCFNDGYHAVHHQHPGLHWSAMAARFQTHWQDYAARGVLVFAGIPNNQVVWWRLMRKDYEYLATHLLSLEVVPRTVDEKIALLRQRVHARPA